MLLCRTIEKKSQPEPLDQFYANHNYHKKILKTNMTNEIKKLSLEPYKGTRDFYPKDQFIQNYIFSVWKKVCESYGYLEYNASILEETELYKSKSGEEIVNEQTYFFIDRGGRNVTIRPEMTPTVARMVAQKRKELSFPLRWFSIPNLFRYERPQRGRLREHWQLNADMFGVDSIEADVEIISLAYSIMKGFNAKDEDFEIRINDRRAKLVGIEENSLSEDQKHKIVKLIDKKSKMASEAFSEATKEILGKVIELSYEETEHTKQVIALLNDRGIVNAKFNSSLVRGFDYYTGMVFEVFDTNPENSRSIFGGGRYDDLVSIFGVEKVSGIGFGLGDVTTRDFLETHNLLPEYRPPVKLYICHLEGYIEEANKLAHYIREQGVNVAVDLSDRQVSKQVKTADKESIPYIIVVGEEEVKSEKFKVKSLKDSLETEVKKEDLEKFFN